ncbi:MAG: tetratricopeptide repeat protein [Lentisphaeria bacterium]|nr:tetratricopeptide repeat protein [Lentisphaeria bacterium]
MESLYPYTPRKSSFEDLKHTFVARQVLLDEMIEAISDQRGAETPQHWMILGVRGMGKSHLITMVYHMVKRDEQLSKHWLPVLMNEEEHGVFSLHTLFIRILTKLGEELSGADKKASEAIMRFLDKLRDSGGAEDEILEDVVAFLKDFVKTSGRRLLILLENADELLTRYLSRKNDIKKFRNILQHDKFFMLISTSPTFFKGISSSKAPLYDFFRIRQLDLLSYEASVDLLNRWAELEGKSGEEQKHPLRFRGNDYRLRVLYHLTGGNPRILLFLYMAISGQDGIQSAVDTFSKLLEEDLSSYYLSRMRDLSNQVQPIVVALAESSGSLTQTEIARLTFLPAKSIGTAMVRLEQDGLVRAVSEKKGKNTLYALTDQLFRLWYQWRTHADERRVITAVVEFLAVWYRKKQLIQWAGEEGISGVHCKEALAFRESENFRKVIEPFCQDSEKYINEHLSLKDYPAVFETLDLLKEYGVSVSGLRKSAFDGVKKDKRIDDAEEYFRERIKKDESDLEALSGLGRILYEKDNYAGAEEAFSKSVELSPENASFWDALGEARWRQDNYAGAEEAMNKAVELSPEEASFWSNLGLTRRLQENYAGAEEAFSKAADLSPEDASFWGALGAIRWRQDNYAGAEEAFSKAVKLSPEDASFWNALGVIRWHQDNYAGTEEAMNKTVELSPEDASFWSNLGEAQLALGDSIGSEKSFIKAMALNPALKLKARIGLLQAYVNVKNQDSGFFKENLSKAVAILNQADALKEEDKQDVIGQIFDVLTAVLNQENIKTIRIYLEGIREASEDLGRIFKPFDYVLDYFDAFFAAQIDKKATADRAQRVLDSVASEIRGPVEGMIEKVKKRLNHSD